METMGGQHNLHLVCRREPAGVTVLWARAFDSRAVLPEVVLGLPVTGLGHHAFAPDAPKPEGTEVRVASGRAPGEGDNRKLRRLTLPPTLRQVGSYGLYNCTGLEELRLSAETRDWGGCALMNCGSLTALHIQQSEEGSEALRYFADELSCQLDVSLYRDEVVHTRLIFPEYYEDYENNDPAHHFDYHIYGGGYPYHHAFRDKALSLPAFDAAWDDYLKAQHDPQCALRLSFFRLRYPTGLSQRAEQGYLDYISGRLTDALCWLVEEDDPRGLSWLLSRCPAHQDALRAACGLARTLQRREALALLLEGGHRRPRPARSFEL